MPEPLIILGRSVRAAAQSAIRAGFEPWCVDCRADLDLQQIAKAQRCPADQYPMGMLPLLDDAPEDAPVMLTADLENYPEFVEAAAIDRQLLGCSAEALRSVRDPNIIAAIPPIPGVRFCKTRKHESWLRRLRRFLFGGPGQSRFLLKPMRGHAGRGIEWWAGGEIPDGRYIQQFIPGTPLSAVFHTDGWSAILVGVTEQLVGQPAFGSSRFQYCGSIGPFPLDENQRVALSQLGVILAQQHDLRGMVGVDLVLDKKNILWPVEVNPRYTDSVEVIEQLDHIAALKGRKALDRRKKTKGPAVLGKALLFAHTETTVPDLSDLPQDHLADIPPRVHGSAIHKGDHLCTIHTSAPTRDTCLTRLRQLASQLYETCTQPHHE